MGDTPKEPTSFNPKEWGKPTGESSKPPDPPAQTPPAEAADRAGGTSFNPKSWSAGSGADAVTMPVAPLAPKSPASRRGRTPIVAAAAVVGVAAIGAATWFATRPAPPPTGAVASAAQLGAPPAGEQQRRTLVVRQPGEIVGALTSVGVPQSEAGPAAAAAMSKLIKKDGDLTLIMLVRPVAGGNRLVNLDARYEDGAGVVVAATPAGFSAQATAADLKTTVKVVRGEMDAYSFYTSAVAQHLTDSLISPFAQALTFDFDFQREIHAGDVFEAAFENRVNARGETVAVGRLLYVALETKEKSRALYWFQPPGADGGWFDGNGQSTVRSLMRTPVEGARISSTFGMRVHPVLGFMKMHKGTDFAAPIGTPIYAAGDATVIFAAMAGTAGNRVILKHDNGWETWYLHMNQFGPGIASGVHVHQGQQIGEIGTTGRSTGPHLHYELHINDEPVDPMSVATEGGKPLIGADLKAFFKERDRIDALRAAQVG